MCGRLGSPRRHDARCPEAHRLVLRRARNAEHSFCPILASLVVLELRVRVSTTDIILMSSQTVCHSSRLDGLVCVQHQAIFVTVESYALSALHPANTNILFSPSWNRALQPICFVAVGHQISLCDVITSSVFDPGLHKSTRRGGTNDILLDACPNSTRTFLEHSGYSYQRYSGPLHASFRQQWS